MASLEWQSNHKIILRLSKGILKPLLVEVMHHTHTHTHTHTYETHIQTQAPRTHTSRNNTHTCIHTLNIPPILKTPCPSLAYTHPRGPTGGLWAMYVIPIQFAILAQEDWAVGEIEWDRKRKWKRDRLREGIKRKREIDRDKARKWGKERERERDVFVWKGEGEVSCRLPEAVWREWSRRWCSVQLSPTSCFCTLWWLTSTSPATSLVPSHQYAHKNTH